MAPAVTLPTASIVATAGVTLLQVPPGVRSPSSDVPELQIVVPPVIAAGCTFTVTVAVAAQLPIVYDIMELPDEIPVTTPVPLTVAMPPLTLVHAPPIVASVRFVDDKSHSVNVPVIAAGSMFTVTVAVEAQLPMV